MLNRSNYLPKPEEVEPIPHEPGYPTDLAKTVNEALSDYRKTENALALWEVVRLCLEHDLTLPKQIRRFLLGVSAGLLELVGREGARADVADLVLGTRNDQGGYSEFERYKAHKDRQALVQLVDSKMFEDSVMTRAKSQADVFEEVAVEKGLSSDYVKKVYSKENPARSGLSIEEHRRALERLRTGAAVTELGAAIDTTKKSGE
ncbi:hypothetical protein [Bradyrhizobium tunisiense]|uniref:hypothetical protein n=1 Tax=Bradyrhizobium tunisiense TaxID=3278709 RepID=UPI0035E181BA